LGHLNVEDELAGVRVTPVSEDTGHVKCPRCWHYTHVGLFNFDGLCDRCCGVILDNYPDHWSVPGIRAKQKEQEERWNIKLCRTNTDQ
jgi:hypothetical protein